MLKRSDEEWLRKAYPKLVQDGDVIVGELPFVASYDSDTNLFSILREPAVQDGSATTLSGSFRVRIQERTDKSTTQLPSVLVEGVEPIPDRHFNAKDRSACLCSPLEEKEFLEPDFSFRLFLEQLVVPFLYGQVFFSAYGRWPWVEYAHGATGILEAYSRNRNRKCMHECLRQLMQDSNWPRIQSALQQKPYAKGHIACFCPQMDQIRRCHPRALEGLLCLQRDLARDGLAISVGGR